MAKTNPTMNNNITEDYCSFEVAKLLKEKGFRVPTEKHYMGSKKIYDISPSSDHNNPSYTKEMYSAPTHALAVKWIRDNFDIHITTARTYTNSEYNFFYQIYFLQKKEKILLQCTYFKSPEEATEAALLYTLKHLI